METHGERNQLILDNLIRSLELACFPEGTGKKVPMKQMLDFVSSGLSIATAFIAHIVHNNNQAVSEDKQEIFLQEAFKKIEESVREDLKKKRSADK